MRQENSPSGHLRTADNESHGMHCMEIWGGNQPVDRVVNLPGLEARVISRPLDGAGGDVYYLSLCGGGLVTRILLADVSGHGKLVAKPAVDLRQLIRKFINTKDQSRLVSRLNRQVAAWKADGLFATSLVATYLASRKVFTFSNAGHPRPLLYRAREDRWSLLTSDNSRSGSITDLPLGIIEGTAYPPSSIELEHGDRVIFYTDMLIEAHDSSGTPRGEEGILAIARGLKCGERCAAPQLLETIIADAGPHSPIDDVTILELRHIGDGPRPPSLREKLTIYGKFFRMIPT